MYDSQKEEKKLKRKLFFKFFNYNFLKDRNIEYKEFRYGDNKRDYYRVYKGYDKRKPTIFFIYSGGLWNGSPKGCAAIGKFFYKYGFTVVIPSYELAPEHKYPVQMENIFSAFKHYVENNKPNRIVVMGYSSGADLAANLVYNEDMKEKFNIDTSIISSFITLGGTLDFSQCNSKEYKKYIKKYLYGKEQIFDVNPINLLVSYENSKRFVEKVNKFKGNGQFLKLEGYQHLDLLNLFIGVGNEKTGDIMSFINRF